MDAKTIEKQLATRYLKAKIRVDPHNYKVSDRLLISNKLRTSEGYSAFHRPLLTEYQLHDILDLSRGCADGWFPGMGLRVDDVCANNGSALPFPYASPFLFTRFNNLVLELHTLEQCCDERKTNTARFLASPAFDALMEMMLLMTSPESITPYLHSAIEKENAGRALSEVMDMAFERVAIANEFVPAFADDDLPGMGNDYVMLTFNWSPTDFPDIAPKANVRREISAKLAYFYAMETVYMLNKSVFGDKELSLIHI